MSTNVSLFDFNGQNVRVVQINGSPWFVAVDAFRVLDMDTSKGAAKHLRYLGADETKTHAIVGGKKRGNPNVVIVSESGLYKLILRSTKVAAKPFQDWVTKTVLPAIRKDGGYVAGEEMVATGEMSEDELVLKTLTVMQSKNGEAGITPLLSYHFPKPLR